MLRTIRVYGPLAKFLGKRQFKADVSTAGEAVRFLLANFPQLEAHMSEPDRYYRVSAGSEDLSEEEIQNPIGQETIKIVPVVAGAGAVGRIIAGVALIALSFIPGIGALAVSLMIGIGASLVLGGVAQLISPVPSINPSSPGKDSDKDPRKSYSFSGIQNTSRQGVPVPIVYGETLVGSVTISAGIDTVQI